MSCFTTSSFFVHINGKTYGNILPSRGLLQGDPLSPYLFILCAEGFTSLLAKVEKDGWLHGVSICRRASSISHLLFVDDSLLFCQANQQKVQVLNDTSQLYVATSGQCINFKKSSAFFTSNTAIGQKKWIKSTLGVKELD